jgi:hypothetical protein
MTFRYINSDDETLERAREIVDEINTVTAPSTTRIIEVDGAYWDKKLSMAQRRFTRACEALARVR